MENVYANVYVGNQALQAPLLIIIFPRGAASQESLALQNSRQL